MFVKRALAFTPNTSFSSGSRLPPSSFFVSNRSFTGKRQSPQCFLADLRDWVQRGKVHLSHFLTFLSFFELSFEMASFSISQDFRVHAKALRLLNPSLLKLVCYVRISN